MRDALGGVVNIAIIVVFMVIVSGYLAFNVNYTKAFRVKNKIISVIENREGLDPNGIDEIYDYAKSIGYNVKIPNSFKASERWEAETKCGFYYKQVSSDIGSDRLDKGYYEIITFVSIDIPIIKNIMPHIEFFQVKGSTKSIKNLGSN